MLIEFSYICRVWCEGGEIEAVRSGRLTHRATSRRELPAVGDWVMVRKRRDDGRGAIIAVLPRRSWFSRRMAGPVTDEQVVAANVDVVFIVMSLDFDFSLRRLERYLLLARESGASPVVLLTKPDVCEDVPASRRGDALTGDVPVHVVSPKLGEGLDRVAGHCRRERPEHCSARQASARARSSIASLAATSRRPETFARPTRRGRHTTTHRQLVFLPNGGFLIDTPGMRELQLWDVGEAVRETFDEIEALAIDCRFTDCRHRDEPRCAVKAAVEDGRLSAARLESYLAPGRTRPPRRSSRTSARNSERRSKIMGKALKQHLKSKRG